MSENGVFEGFNVDIMNAISRETGLDLEIVPMDWEDAINALENGQVDVVQGMTITDYRDIVLILQSP